MKKIKPYLTAGFIFVLVAGTLAHFVYDWTEKNSLAGLFTPVNESTWEHMKLVFFPMLIYSLFVYFIFQKEYPCILYAFLAGTLAGTYIMPVIFYTYTGIIGRNFFVLDLVTFLLCVITAFAAASKLSARCISGVPITPYPNCFGFFIGTLSLLTLAAFIIFTIYPPEIGLFAPPA